MSLQSALLLLILPFTNDAEAAQQEWKLGPDLAPKEAHVLDLPKLESWKDGNLDKPKLDAQPIGKLKSKVEGKLKSTLKCIVELDLPPASHGKSLHAVEPDTKLKSELKSTSPGPDLKSKNPKV